MNDHEKFARLLCMDELLAAGFNDSWLRISGDDLARWYRTDTIRSIEAFS